MKKSTIKTKVKRRVSKIDNNNNTTARYKTRSNESNPETENSEGSNESATLDDVEQVTMETEDVSANDGKKRSFRLFRKKLRPGEDHAKSEGHSGEKGYVPQNLAFLNAGAVDPSVPPIDESVMQQFFVFGKVTKKRDSQTFEMDRSYVEEQRPPLEQILDKLREFAEAQSQVKATDIMPDNGVQTSDSLRSRGPSLPPRLPGSVTGLRGGKNPCYRDCIEPHTPCNSEANELQQMFEMQVCAGDICPSAFSQTGPSLSAEGSFCRFDYYYKKAKHPKEDIYEACCKKNEQKNSIPCNCENAICRTIDSQVAATDIQITESLQTGASLADLPPYQKGSAKAPLPKNYKSRELEACEWPVNRKRSNTSYKDYGTQVKATKICPSIHAQAGDSLTMGGKVVKAKFVKSHDDLFCGCERPEKCTKSGNVKFKNILIQVTASDLGTINCCQTGDSLMDMPPLNFATDGVRRCKDGRIKGRAYNISWFCEPKEKQSNETHKEEKATQVAIIEICPEQECQTGDSLLVSKCVSRNSGSGSSMNDVEQCTASPGSSEGSGERRVHVPYMRRKKKTEGPDTGTQTRQSLTDVVNG